MKTNAIGTIQAARCCYAFVAHLDQDDVEEHQRIERLQRPVPPFGDLLEDGVRDRAGEIAGDVDPIGSTTSLR
jgi:hypothetical protein